jgi:hypothetical protein
MSERRLPLHPNLDQLKHQAKDLLREMQRDTPGAKRADAQHALARSYGASNWARLVHSCRLVDAIWRDDIETVRALVTANPHLIHENAEIGNGNWGPPMSYAANLGHDRLIVMLRELGATDAEQALDRAVLQGRLATATLLHAMLGNPSPPPDALGSPAYTLSVTGTEFLFHAGARVYGDDGRMLAPVDVVLFSDSRRPAAKHRILEIYVEHGLRLPDTPAMALHRGRIDLLEDHLRRDPDLLRRTFTHAEIFPPEFGCRSFIDTQGTPLDGTTLLHMCVDFDELDIARWLLERGMDPDARAAVDADGFGGHTALFGGVVSWAHFWINPFYGPGRPDEAAFARLLLDAGANPTARASLRREVQYEDKHFVHQHRDATPLTWGRDFPYKLLVSKRAMELVAAASAS